MKQSSELMQWPEILFKYTEIVEKDQANHKQRKKMKPFWICLKNIANIFFCNNFSLYLNSI